MLYELSLVLVGAIAGAILGVLLPPVIEIVRRRYSHRKKLIRDSNLSNEILITWLQKFHQYQFEHRNIPNELPFCQIGGFGDFVPYLSKDKWDTPNDLSELQPVNIESDELLSYTDPPERNFDIKQKLIDERIEWGHDIWNSSTLYLEQISYEDGHPKFHVTATEYYASATQMILLENETVRAVKNNRFTKCKLREKYYLQTGNIEKNMFRPITIGCLVVFALRLENGYSIMIQERSEKNVTSNKVNSVCPTFGLSPFVGTTPMRKGLLYYNFLREYLEELHFVRDIRELKKEDKTLGSIQSYHDYIYGHDKATMLTKSDHFNLYYIGFGFNLTNGNPNIGLLAVLDDTSACNDIIKSRFINWEVRSIKDVSIDSGELELLFSTRKLDPASIFFLSRALKCLKNSDRAKS